MKYTVLVVLAVATISIQAIAQYTPSSATATGVEMYQDQYSASTAYPDCVINNGYVGTDYMRYPSSIPPETDIYDILCSLDMSGLVWVSTHGNTTAILLESYSNDSAGYAALMDRWDNWYLFDADEAYPVHGSGYNGIAVYYAMIAEHVRSADSVVVSSACHSWANRSNWGEYRLYYGIEGSEGSGSADEAPIFDAVDEDGVFPTSEQVITDFRIEARTVGAPVNLAPRVSGDPVYGATLTGIPDGEWFEWSFSSYMSSEVGFATNEEVEVLESNWETSKKYKARLRGLHNGIISICANFVTQGGIPVVPAEDCWFFTGPHNSVERKLASVAEQ